MSTAVPRTPLLRCTRFRRNPTLHPSLDTARLQGQVQRRSPPPPTVEQWRHNGIPLLVHGEASSPLLPVPGRSGSRWLRSSAPAKLVCVSMLQLLVVCYDATAGSLRTVLLELAEVNHAGDKTPMASNPLPRRRDHKAGACKPQSSLASWLTPCEPAQLLLPAQTTDQQFLASCVPHRYILAISPINVYQAFHGIRFPRHSFFFCELPLHFGVAAEATGAVAS